MFQVKPHHIRRVSFATKLFPKLRSALNLDTKKLKSTDGYDGELFCGGRSKNKDLLTFFGQISELRGCASFAQLPMFRRSIKKLVSLVEQELETVGGREVLLPTLVPEKLWHKSKRLERQPDALNHVYKLLGENETKFILGPTFEESITQMVRDLDTINEQELPLLLYQTSTKFRLEPNPRFGLIRSNEFLMNDLYSFDANLDKAIETYHVISSCYKNIFDKLKLNYKRIESETGNIGGKYSHEYQLEVSSGEDTVIKCQDCKSTYNSEMTTSKTEGDKDKCMKCGGNNLAVNQALELGHTFLLSDTYSKPLGATFAPTEGTKSFFEMGCYGLGLTRILGAGIDLFSITDTDESSEKLLQVRWPNSVEPYKVGVVSPAKRSKEYHAGSTDFIRRLVDNILDINPEMDIIVEDREKEGILKRLYRLKSLGIPHILTVGQRFIQDRPEVELLKLDSEKKNYEQVWLTEDQVYDYLKKLEG